MAIKSNILTSMKFVLNYYPICLLSNWWQNVEFWLPKRKISYVYRKLTILLLPYPSAISLELWTFQHTAWFDCYGIKIYLWIDLKKNKKILPSNIQEYRKAIVNTCISQNTEWSLQILIHLKTGRKLFICSVED